MAVPPAGDHGLEDLQRSVPGARLPPLRRTRPRPDSRQHPRDPPTLRGGPPTATAAHAAGPPVCAGVPRAITAVTRARPRGGARGRNACKIPPKTQRLAARDTAGEGPRAELRASPGPHQPTSSSARNGLRQLSATHGLPPGAHSMHRAARPWRPHPHCANVSRLVHSKYDTPRLYLAAPREIYAHDRACTRRLQRREPRARPTPRGSAHTLLRHRSPRQACPAHGFHIDRSSRVARAAARSGVRAPLPWPAVCHRGCTRRLCSHARCGEEVEAWQSSAAHRGSVLRGPVGRRGPGKPDCVPRALGSVPRPTCDRAAPAARRAGQRKPR